jgi:hypothetical protein
MNIEMNRCSMSRKAFYLNEGIRLARFCALVPKGSVSLATESHGVGPRSGPFRFQAPEPS